MKNEINQLKKSGELNQQGNAQENVNENSPVENTYLLLQSLHPLVYCLNELVGNENLMDYYLHLLLGNENPPQAEYVHLLAGNLNLVACNLNMLVGDVNLLIENEHPLIGHLDPLAQHLDTLGVNVHQMAVNLNLLAGYVNESAEVGNQQSNVPQAENVHGLNWNTTLPSENEDRQDSIAHLRDEDVIVQEWLVNQLAESVNGPIWDFHRRMPEMVVLRFENGNGLDWNANLFSENKDVPDWRLNRLAENVRPLWDENQFDNVPQDESVNGPSWNVSLLAESVDGRDWSSVNLLAESVIWSDGIVNLVPENVNGLLWNVSWSSTGICWPGT